MIGPPGSGKTNVLIALHDALADSDIAHAVIEVEAVAWAHPPLSDEQSLRHLKSACCAHRAAGCQLVLVGATATSADYLAAVRAAIAADDYLVVRLEADPLALRERIIAREPAEWSGLPQLLVAADEIALVSRSLEGVHLVPPWPRRLLWLPPTRGRAPPKATLASAPGMAAGNLGVSV